MHELGIIEEAFPSPVEMEEHFEKTVGVKIPWEDSQSPITRFFVELESASSATEVHPEADIEVD